LSFDNLYLLEYDFAIKKRFEIAEIIINLHKKRRKQEIKCLDFENNEMEMEED